LLDLARGRRDRVALEQPPGALVGVGRLGVAPGVVVGLRLRLERLDRLRPLPPRVELRHGSVRLRLAGRLALEPVAQLPLALLRDLGLPALLGRDDLVELREQRLLVRVALLREV